eukprot:scaffold160339_cov32-Tisochrysis_lutea.AAC.1
MDPRGHVPWLHVAVRPSEARYWLPCTAGTTPLASPSAGGADKCWRWSRVSNMCATGREGCAVRGMANSTELLVGG